MLPKPFYTNTMKTTIRLILILIIVVVWMFPVIISFYYENFWYCFLYLIWWIPASMIMGLMLAIEEEL
jgi:hypothetical protein